jgi:uncharacterized protein (TIGR03000 family)
MISNPLSSSRLALALAPLLLCFGSLASAQETSTAPIFFEVKVPPGTILQIDEYKTTSKGEVRRFETPPLATGKVYSYKLEATLDGTKIVRKIKIRHGETNRIDLTADLLAKEDKGSKPPAGASGVARLESGAGSLALRAEGSKDWQLPGEGSPLEAGALCVGLPNATIDSANGNVRVYLRANFDKLSPLPSVESAIRLQKTSEFDMEFYLDRGQIVLANLRKQGESTVRVHFQDRYWDLTLKDPDSRAGLELCGSWLPGRKFNPKSEKTDHPAMMLILLALKGHIDRKCPVCEHGLKAPPGPACVIWDSVGGQDEKPEELATIPEWAQPRELDPERKERIKKFHAMLQSKPLKEVLQSMLASDDPNMRRGGVYASAALDQLDLVADALLEGKYPDLWEHAVLALRHWISREAGNDKKLYQGMVERGKLTPAEAATAVQLLHSFSDEELRQPETYELLIEYLKHSKLAIRGLANWHLQRVVPAGRKIKYDPAGSKESHLQAYKAWKALIPDGKLPPSVTPEKSGT